MEKLFSKFLNCDTFAVIGSFRSEEKFAYQIARYLIKKGKTVFPVNPTAKDVLGLPCSPEIGLLPVKPEVVSLVTPPEVTEKIVRECGALGIDKVWMQPGAESEKSIRFCVENGIQVIHDACILLQ